MKTYTQLINLSEDYIEKNLNKSIRLVDIANNLHISAYHFHRLFHGQTNETLTRFINRIKLERSAMLLVTNKKISITEIAYAYGYSESSSYSRAFKKHFHVSPRQYRKARYVNFSSNE